MALLDCGNPQAIWQGGAHTMRRPGKLDRARAAHFQPPRCPAAALPAAGIPGHRDSGPPVRRTRWGRLLRFSLFGYRVGEDCHGPGVVVENHLDDQAGHAAGRVIERGGQFGELQPGFG